MRLVFPSRAHPARSAPPAQTMEIDTAVGDSSATLPTAAAPVTSRLGLSPPRTKLHRENGDVGAAARSLPIQTFEGRAACSHCDQGRVEARASSAALLAGHTPVFVACASLLLVVAASRFFFGSGPRPPRAPYHPAPSAQLLSALARPALRPAIVSIAHSMKKPLRHGHAAVGAFWTAPRFTALSLRQAASSPAMATTPRRAAASARFRRTAHPRSSVKQRQQWAPPSRGASCCHTPTPQCGRQGQPA